MLVKKISLITLIILSISSSSYAQFTWAPPGSIWTYEGYGALKSFIEIEYIGDTIINGLQSKILQKKETVYRSTTKDTVVNHLGAEYIHVDDSLVYLYNNQNFDTLYHFGAKPNDSWSLGCCETEFENNDCFVTVEDTGTITVNGQDLY